MEGGRFTLPPLLELRVMCEQRAGHLEWPLRRLSEILGDFPEVSWRMVAGRCLDYIAEREGVRDGPRTLRTFMEREQRELDSQKSDRPHAARPDVWTYCISCGNRFNVTEQVRRPDRSLITVCGPCFDEETKTDEHPSSEESIEREEAADDAGA